MFDPRVGRRWAAAGGRSTKEQPMRGVEEFDRVSHAAVVDAFRRRDPEAVRELYREYGRLVYAVAHRVLGRRDLAEDAVQQTFVNAWQAADRFDVTRDLASWLATIARRNAIDIYRRELRRRASALTEVATDNPAVVSLPPDLDAVEAVWHVRLAIDALAPEEATIVRLQHLDGMTHAEISDKLGIALGTVKSRSHRAHRRLARQLGHLREPVA
jgi:RNA polymerase sigma-70 factor (ECF subfamily)